MLVIMQNEWAKAAADIQSFRDIAISVGHTPRPPVILTNVSVAESREEAQDRATQYLGAKWDSIDNHYNFSDGHLGAIKGYESYGKMAKTYSKLKDEEARAKLTDFYVKIQIVGTPQDCIEQVRELQGLTGTDHIVCDFSYGGMPHEEGEMNMRLFADRVMPTLQHDAAFRGPVAIPDSPAQAGSDVFAPA
jgi:alkanesulfonate monooxygenase SsuD/methylene tetrahydromethanopterin reductase-like flavin-dependent oxidoreductase (luciferase family)